MVAGATPLRPGDALRRFRGRLTRRVRAAQAVVPLEQVVIGVGAQKSGTTWLAKVLERHPEIYLRGKEAHYWDVVRYPFTGWDTFTNAMGAPDRARTPFGRSPMDHSGYLPFLEFGRSEKRVVADITPAYALCTAETFREMRDVHDNVKFVFLMRDPVERLWSGIRHTLRAVLERDPDLGRSRYDRTLASMEAAGCNLHVAFYEHLFSDAALASLADFLEVDGLEGDYDRVEYAGARHKATLGADLRARAREALAETYDYVFDRFGDAVPDQWRRGQDARTARPGAQAEVMH